MPKGLKLSDDRVLKVEQATKDVVPLSTPFSQRLDWFIDRSCAGCANAVAGKPNTGLPGNLETGNFVCKDCSWAYAIHWTK